MQETTKDQIKTIKETRQEDQEEGEADGVIIIVDQNVRFVEN